MSKATARAVSTGVLGGVMIVLFVTQGLLFWAGLIAWAGLVAAGGDTTALKKGIGGYVLGAALAWVALLTTHLIVVESDSWLWMPRIGAAVAVTLFVLVLASKIDIFSSIPAGLMAYGALIGAYSIPIMQLDGWARLTGLHLYNPIIQVVLSMVLGGVFGLLATRFEAGLSKG